MPHRMLLVKILPRQFVVDFLNGNLHLNTNKFFGTVDQTDIVRHDPHDGIDESNQIERYEVQDEDGGWLLIPTLGPMSIRNKLSKFLNILCLYTITDRLGDEFDERNLRFGDIGIVISDPSEFAKRLTTAAQSVKKKVFYRDVEYVDRNSHDGAMGPFMKFSTLRYQNEFRFVLDGGNSEACKLPVGELRDITRVIASSDIPKLRRKAFNL